MSVEPVQLMMSVDDYLKMESTASIKHEFVRGCVFAMVGASDAHNRITLNIVAMLHSHLKGSQCRAYVSDMKVRIEQANVFYYPDVMVTCEQYSAKSVFKSQPVLIVEVLSPSTADIDRREKLANYGLLPSLSEYLLVHQNKRLIELYCKNESGWQSSSKIDGNGSVRLQSIPGSEIELPLDDIYAELTDI